MFGVFALLLVAGTLAVPVLAQQTQNRAQAGDCVCDCDGVCDCDCDGTCDCVCDGICDSDCDGVPDRVRDRIHWS